MLRRIFGGFIVGGAVLFSFGACNDNGVRGGYYYGDYGYGYDTCGQFTSCGACTLARGCGWCTAGGFATCLGDPDECGANSFSWTWTPDGCSGSSKADGGTANGAPDAGAKSPADAGKTD